MFARSARPAAIALQARRRAARACVDLPRTTVPLEAAVGSSFLPIFTAASLARSPLRQRLPDGKKCFVCNDCGRTTAVHSVRGFAFCNHSSRLLRLMHAPAYRAALTGAHVLPGIDVLTESRKPHSGGLTTFAKRVARMRPRLTRTFAAPEQQLYR